jgi:hypothetical protein
MFACPVASAHDVFLLAQTRDNDMINIRGGGFVHDTGMTYCGKMDVLRIN